MPERSKGLVCKTSIQRFESVYLLTLEHPVTSKLAGQYVFTKLRLDRGCRTECTRKNTDQIILINSMVKLQSEIITKGTYSNKNNSINVVIENKLFPENDLKA